MVSSHLNEEILYKQNFNCCNRKLCTYTAWISCWHQ